MKDVTHLFPVRYSLTCQKCKTNFYVSIEQEFSEYQTCSDKCLFSWTYNRVLALDKEIKLSWAKLLLTSRALNTSEKNINFQLTKSLIRKSLYMNLLAHEPAQAQTPEPVLAHLTGSTPPIWRLSREPRAEPRAKSMSQENEVLRL